MQRCCGCVLFIPFSYGGGNGEADDQGFGTRKPEACYVRTKYCTDKDLGTRSEEQEGSYFDGTP